MLVLVLVQVVCMSSFAQDKPSGFLSSSILVPKIQIVVVTLCNCFCCDNYVIQLYFRYLKGSCHRCSCFCIWQLLLCLSTNCASMWLTPGSISGGSHDNWVMLTDDGLMRTTMMMIGMWIKTFCSWWFVDSISEEEFGCGHLRPTENIVTDAAKEPGNFMQVIAIDIIGMQWTIGIGQWALGIWSTIRRIIACLLLYKAV